MASFSRHPNAKHRRRLKAPHYAKHTIRASLRRHGLRIRYLDCGCECGYGCPPGDGCRHP